MTVTHYSEHIWAVSLIFVYSQYVFLCCRYAIIFKKGYQEFDDVQGAVTTKLKGVARTENLFSNHSGERIWDVADYVVPPQVSTDLVNNCHCIQ